MIVPDDDRLAKVGFYRKLFSVITLKEGNVVSIPTKMGGVSLRYKGTVGFQRPIVEFVMDRL